MKKWLLIILIPIFSLSSCSGWYGSPAAVEAGASIGGIIGAIVGDHAGGNVGSQFGAILGTVTGAVVGNALSTPKIESDNYDDSFYPYEISSSEYSPIIISNIRFIDDNRNRIIDAQESGKIIFDIINNSSEPLYNVAPVITNSGVKHLHVSTSQIISFMEPGSQIRYIAYISAGKRLKNGIAKFNLYVTDSNGVIGESRRFYLPTLKKIRY